MVPSIRPAVDFGLASLPVTASPGVTILEPPPSAVPNRVRTFGLGEPICVALSRCRSWSRCNGSAFECRIRSLSLLEHVPTRDTRWCGRRLLWFSMAANGSVDGDARTACVQVHAFRRDIFQECRHARCQALRSARAQTVAGGRLRLTGLRLRAPLGARPVPRCGVCVPAAGTSVHIAGRAHVWLRLRLAPLHSEQESACMSLGLASPALRRLTWARTWTQPSDVI